MLQSGTNVTSEKLIVIAQHVHKELTVRLARRLLDMQTLPYVVVINPNIQKVFGLYNDAFKTLVNFPKVGWAYPEDSRLLQTKSNSYK